MLQSQCSRYANFSSLPLACILSTKASELSLALLLRTSLELQSFVTDFPHDSHTYHVGRPLPVSLPRPTTSVNGPAWSSNHTLRCSPPSSYSSHPRGHLLARRPGNFLSQLSTFNPPRALVLPFIYAVHPLHPRDAQLTDVHPRFEDEATWADVT